MKNWDVYNVKREEVENERDNGGTKDWEEGVGSQTNCRSEITLTHIKSITWSNSQNNKAQISLTSYYPTTIVNYTHHPPPQFLHSYMNRDNDQISLYNHTYIFKDMKIKKTHTRNISFYFLLVNTLGPP